MDSRGTKRRRTKHGRAAAELDQEQTSELKAWLRLRRSRLVAALLRCAGWTKVVRVEAQGDCWLIAARVGTPGLAHTDEQQAALFSTKRRTLLTAFRACVHKGLTEVGHLHATPQHLAAFAQLIFPTRNATGKALQRTLLLDLGTTFSKYKVAKSWAEGAGSHSHSPSPSLSPSSSPAPSSSP